MKRRIFLSAMAAGIGLSAVLGSAVYAAFPTSPSNSVSVVDPANHSQWDENGYYSGFGGALPPGIVEGSAGFSTIGNYDGRVLSNAGVTTNNFDSNLFPLTTISTNLFSGTDVNLYAIAVTNPATFSASVGSSTLLMAMFNSAGKGLAASLGTTLNSTNDGITAPGIYYIGLADGGLFPADNSGGLLFGAPTAVGAYPALLSTALSTNPNQAWASSLGIPTNPLMANTSFLAGSSTITLTGAQYAVVPEPTTLGILGAGSLGLLARRRKRA
jgi:hypothetical protein